MSEEDIDSRKLIVDLRGGVPPKCDFCGRECPPEQLHPEEAGEWVCNLCLERWALKDLVKALRAELTTLKSQRGEVLAEGWVPMQPSGVIDVQLFSFSESYAQKEMIKRHSFYPLEIPTLQDFEERGYRAIPVSIIRKVEK